jgi:hypothetical protein
MAEREPQFSFAWQPKPSQRTRRVWRPVVVNERGDLEQVAVTCHVDGLPAFTRAAGADYLRFRCRDASRNKRSVHRNTLYLNTELRDDEVDVQPVRRTIMRSAGLHGHAGGRRVGATPLFSLNDPFEELRASAHRDEGVRVVEDDATVLDA